MAHTKTNDKAPATVDAPTPASTMPNQTAEPTLEEVMKDISRDLPKVKTDTVDAAKVTSGTPATGSAALSGANNNPNNIARFDRTQISLGSGDTTKFPKNLSEKRYINIQIYNTIQKDPNALVADAAGLVVKTATGFFNDNGVESFGELGDALSTLWNGAKDTADAFTDGLSGLKDVGNPSVGSLAGAPVWMDEIWLPLPNDISEGLNHSWDEGKGALDALYAGGAAMVSSISKAMGGTDMSGMGGSTGSDGFGGTSAVQAVTGYSNIVSKMTGTQALSYNENKLIQYSKTEFRSIDLKWTLVPNSEDENKTLQLIFAKLKAYSSPQAVSGKILLRAPFFCRLKFYNPTLNDALQFDECVITQIGINYSAAGTMETFNDDMPKVMELNITFKDREPKTLQAWAKEQNYGG